MLVLVVIVVDQLLSSSSTDIWCGGGRFERVSSDLLLVDVKVHYLARIFAPVIFREDKRGTLGQPGRRLARCEGWKIICDLRFLFISPPSRTVPTPMY
jgi:hypothetical protein